jgi:hypothetical protein
MVSVTLQSNAVEEYSQIPEYPISNKEFPIMKYCRAGGFQTTFYIDHSLLDIQ